MTTNKNFITTDDKSKSFKTYDFEASLQQETVSSPILFNIYHAQIINSFDLNGKDNDTYSIAFADDLIIYVNFYYLIYLFVICT